MFREPASLAILALLSAVICGLVPATVHADPLPLTANDIEFTMAVREQADTLRIKALARASKNKAGDESFAAALATVQRIGDEADQQACSKHGIAVDRYRNNLRRLIAVGELVFFEGIMTELEAELHRRTAMTDDGPARNADETAAATEEWLAGARAEQAGNDLPPGYGDSLEAIVGEPVRRQAADGTLKSSVRQANEKRIAEIRRTMAEIGQRLAAPAMSQAALDKTTVTAMVDLPTLQTLSSSLVEEIPALH